MFVPLTGTRYKAPPMSQTTYLPPAVPVGSVPLSINREERRRGLLLYVIDYKMSVVIRGGPEMDFALQSRRERKAAPETGSESNTKKRLHGESSWKPANHW